MAHLKRGEKTAAVRNYLAENPKASSKAVVEGLKEKGINVKVTLVNSIKYKKPSKGRGRRAMSMNAAARRGRARGVSVEQLIQVKRLANALGGVDQLRHALDALAQLQ